VNGVCADLLDAHLHATVVKQQDIACVDVLNQFGIVEADPTLIAQSAFNVEYKFVALAQFDPPLSEFSDANLRTLKVGQDANVAPKTGRKTPNESDPRRMFFGRPVRKIHPDHIDPGGQNPLKDFWFGGGRTKGRDNFGRTMRCHWQNSQAIAGIKTSTRVAV
jgi:hypothetical protein